MTDLNGRDVAGPDPTRVIAEAVYTITAGEDDPKFAEIEPEDLEDILTLTAAYIAAHLLFLTQQGYRLFPPGVTPIPTSEDEALAMVKAAQRFLDGRKRKSRLVGSVAPKKLILPPGTKLQ